MRWIYKVAQAPNTTLSLPDEIQCFLDPLKVISQYRSCKLNKSKSFIESYSLGVVRKYIKRRPLEGAHNSLVDAKAHTDIVLHKDFIDFIDKAKSVRTIDSIIMKNEQNEVRKKFKPVRPVHGNWQEPPNSWKLPPPSSYNGYASGGKHGPSNKMMKYIRNANGLCDIFFFFWPISLLQKIVKYTNQYYLYSSSMDDLVL